MEDLLPEWEEREREIETDIPYRNRGGEEKITPRTSRLTLLKTLCYLSFVLSKEAQRTTKSWWVRSPTIGFVGLSAILDPVAASLVC